MLFFSPYVESLAELASLTEKLFTPLANRDVPIPDFPVHPYSEEQLQVKMIVLSRLLGILKASA